MKELLELARKSADHVEIYARHMDENGISFENAKLKDIESKLLSGVALRLFKDGMVGTAYTQNLIDRDELVRHALASLKGGVEAKYALPGPGRMPAIDSYDAGIENLTNTQMVDECARICDHLRARTNGQVNASVGSGVERINLMNSAGADLSVSTSAYTAYCAVCYPGSFSSITRILFTRGFTPMSDADLNYVVDTFNHSQRETKCNTGRMKVMFLPEAMYALVWRVTEATSARALHERVSPICDRVGQRIFSEKLTIADESRNSSRPCARAFDDEGTPTTDLVLIENGVLRSFYSDLFYASKLGTASTGNGYRGGPQYKPHPELQHTVIRPGDRSFSEMLQMMDHGIIVAGVLGAHSGNILNGDYSIGMSPGLLVENGEIQGQVKDAMVAGNIYETMQNVIAVEDTLHAAGMGTFPAVLFDAVSVATKI